MNKKIIFKYVLMYLPFVVGVGMFSYGSVNLFSSLLLFLGGYIAIKNTVDYRKVKKSVDVAKVNNESNFDLVKREEDTIKVKVKKIDTSKKIYIKPMNPENMVGIKRTRVYKRVRRIR